MSLMSLRRLTRYGNAVSLFLVRDPWSAHRPVSANVAAEAKKAGSEITLKDYVRFELGEGIEKKESDFAAEVAAAAGTQKAEPVA